jgi:parvulin-like peptidyl-prolyl isomerase
MTRASIFLLVLAVAAGLAVAGCGGGGSSLGGSDVAVVGSTHITQNQFDDLMSQAKRSFKSQSRPFPKAGSQDFQTLKNQAVTLLVQQAEREEKAKAMGVQVEDKQIDARLKQIKKQYFQGSETKYVSQLKKQGLTDAQVRRDIKTQLISEQVFKKITKDVKVTAADVHDYYVQHPQLYAQPQSREVRHILVKTKAQADSIYAQLKSGGAFAALAKKYSQDPGSKSTGGKLTVSRGQTVPAFDAKAFSLKVNEISKPVKTQYGWHIIQALGAVKPAKTTPEKQVADSIKQQLLQTKKNEEMTSWVNGLDKDFKGKVKYKAGFTPAATSTSTTTGATTTG